jgi:general secretion pathway protein L
MVMGSLLYVPANPDAPALYAEFDRDGRLQGEPRRGKLEQLQIPPQAQPVALLDGSAALLSRAELPAGTHNRLRQALPYTLEEQLAAEVETLHFALASTSSAGGIASTGSAGGGWLAATVSRAVMDALRPRLGRASVALPDYLALPESQDCLTIVCLEGRALVRGPDCGFSIELAAAPQFIALALQQHPVRRVRLAGELALSLPPETALESLNTPPWQILARTLASTRPPLNLLQGEYAPAARMAGLLRPWVLSAGLLAAWLLLQAGLEWQETRRMQAELRGLNAQIEALYRETFPDARKIVHPRAQMEQQLARLRTSQPQGEQGLLRLLAHFAQAYGQQPGVLLKRLDYRQNRLELELELPRLQTLESLKQSLLALGLEVEIQSADSRDNRVDSRLRLGWKKAAAGK